MFRCCYNSFHFTQFFHPLIFYRKQKSKRMFRNGVYGGQDRNVREFSVRPWCSARYQLRTQINWSTWAACVVQWKVTWNTLRVNCITKWSIMSMNCHPLSSHFIYYMLLIAYWGTTAQSTLGRGAMLLYRSSLEWDSEKISTRPDRVDHAGCRSKWSG